MASNINSINNTLAYTGVLAPTPPNITLHKSPDAAHPELADPTVNDVANFRVGDLWLNRTDFGIFMLVSVAATPLTNGVQQAIWEELQGGAFGPQTDDAVIIGNSGGGLSSTNVGVNGEVLIAATGAPPAFAFLTSLDGTVTFTTGPNSLDLSATNSTPTLFTEDTGTATPALGNLNVIGGNNIHTNGAGSTVTINVAGTTNHTVQVGNATASLTSLAVGLTNQVLLGNTGANPSWGTVPNASLTNSSVTLNGGNNITVTGGTPLALGGTASFNLTGTTNHAVQVGNAGGSLTSLAVGTNGQVLLGSTAANAAFGTLTSSAGSLTYTTGAASLNIDIAGYTSVGTWTPALAFGGASVGIVYNTNYGFYTRIAGLLYYRGQITLSSKGSSTGVATIGGLPFSSAAVAAGIEYGQMDMINMGAALDSPAIFCIVNGSGSTTLVLAMQTTTGTESILDTNFSATTQITFSGFYSV